MSRMKIVKGKRHRVQKRTMRIEIPQTVVNKETGESFERVQTIEVKAGLYKMQPLEQCKLCGLGLRLLADLDIRGCPKCTREALAAISEGSDESTGTERRKKRKRRK